MAEFDVKGGGAKLHANLSVKPEDMFVSIQEKVNNETADQIFDMYQQNESTLAGLLGLGKILSGGTIDPPDYTHGSHSFGIRNLGLEEWPTAQYGLDKDNFKLDAQVGPERDGWRAGVQGTYTFADGGFIGNSDMRGRWNPDYQWKPEYEELSRGAGYEPWLMRNIPLWQWEQMSNYDRYGTSSEGIQKKLQTPAQEEMLPGGGLNEGVSAVSNNLNSIPQGNTGIRANTGSPAPARTPQQPMMQGPISSNPENPYVSSVANHPSVSPPTIPTMGGGLDSLNSVGWGVF